MTQEIEVLRDGGLIPKEMQEALAKLYGEIEKVSASLMLFDLVSANRAGQAIVEIEAAASKIARSCSVEAEF